MKSTFFSSFLIFLGSCLLSPLAFAEHEELIAAMKSQDPTKDVLLSSEFHARLREVERIDSLSHASIAQRYRSAFALFRTAFPEASENALQLRYIKDFPGTLKLVDPDVYGAPFIFFTPRSLNWKKMKLFRRVLNLGDRTIPALIVETEAHPDYYGYKSDFFAEPYIPTLNARVFDFKYAQVIPELSDNTSTANFFYYNKVRPWSEHRRFKQNDQISRPIELSNWAHSSGARYLISSHPDISLIMKHFRTETVKLTFFLWRKDPESIPDFVFQILYRPRLKEPREPQQ